MPMNTRSRSRRAPRNTARRSKVAQRSRATSRSRMSSRVRRGGKTNNLTMAIEKWWSKKAEVKMIYANPYLYTNQATTLAAGQNFTSNITASSIYSLIPLIAQGTNAFQRVGDYIQPRKLVFDFRASLLEPFDVDSHFGPEIWPEDIIVHIMFLTSKTYKSNGAAVAGATDFNTQVTSALMGFNGIQISGFDGTVIGSDKPVNTELFTVIKRMKFRLNRSSGFKSLVQLTGVGTPAPPTTVPLISVGGQDSKHFKVQIPLPKRLQYSNITSTLNEASNHFPFMVAGWTYAHSPLNQVTTTLTPLSIQGNTQLYYTDD
nr:MAG: capsid protein [Cressdnaviricota sp.]